MNKLVPIQLSSSEIGYLWTGYSINELSYWFQNKFVEDITDPEIKELFSFAKKVTLDLLNNRKVLLHKADYIVPVGFSDKDIHLQAKPLFTDRFLLYYLHSGCRFGLFFHAKALAHAARVDVREYLADCLLASVHLTQRVVDLLLSKGLFWRPPTLPAPDKTERIQKKQYLNGWFGNTRPLNSMEIANLYETLEMLAVIEALCLGFMQTSMDKEVKELLQEGRSTAQNQFNEIAELLSKSDLSVPPTLVGEVMDPGNQVYSDRLMMSHITGLFGSVITQYGYSLGTLMKHDLVSHHISLIAKTGAYTEKITKYMISKRWLEKVPGARENY
jgi:hypothetical protein